MRATLARRAETMFARAMALNLENIERSVRAAPPGGRLVDLGCDDGGRTLGFASAARAEEVHGVELAGTPAEAARARGITVTEADLNEMLPFDDARFDVVVSNQVLEHLGDTDIFVSEVARVLAPGGVAVVSTENLASWHNIGALVLGWQPFSLSNVTSRRAGLGNPLAVHRGEPPGAASWQHTRVFSYRGLRELFESHGLVVREVLGAGYFPLPAAAGRLEPRHAAFLTVVASRLESRG
jgi:SAM-dependent methyltransferase